MRRAEERFRDCRDLAPELGLTGFLPDLCHGRLPTTEHGVGATEQDFRRGPDGLGQKLIEGVERVLIPGLPFRGENAGFRQPFDAIGRQAKALWSPAFPEALTEGIEYRLYG